MIEVHRRDPLCGAVEAILSIPLCYPIGRWTWPLLMRAHPAVLIHITRAIYEEAIRLNDLARGDRNSQSMKDRTSTEAERDASGLRHKSERLFLGLPTQCYFSLTSQQRLRSELRGLAPLGNQLHHLRR